MQPPHLVLATTFFICVTTVEAGARLRSAVPTTLPQAVMSYSHPAILSAGVTETPVARSNASPGELTEAERLRDIAEFRSAILGDGIADVARDRQAVADLETMLLARRSDGSLVEQSPAVRQAAMNLVIDILQRVELSPVPTPLTIEAAKVQVAPKVGVVAARRTTSHAEIEPPADRWFSYGR